LILRGVGLEEFLNKYFDLEYVENKYFDLEDGEKKNLIPQIYSNPGSKTPQK
jgi:hypothetical protein